MLYTVYIYIHIIYIYIHIYIYIYRISYIICHKISKMVSFIYVHTSTLFYTTWYRHRCIGQGGTNEENFARMYCNWENHPAKKIITSTRCIKYIQISFYRFVEFSFCDVSFRPSHIGNSKSKVPGPGPQVTAKTHLEALLSCFLQLPPHPETTGLNGSQLIESTNWLCCGHLDVVQLVQAKDFLLSSHSKDSKAPKRHKL